MLRNKPPNPQIYFLERTAVLKAEELDFGALLTHCGCGSTHLVSKVFSWGRFSRLSGESSTLCGFSLSSPGGSPKPLPTPFIVLKEWANFSSSVD